jgi:glycosyltransferase involved in cell wall biosynthesis
MNNTNSQPTIQTTAPEISVVIPCHNEEPNLRPLVKAITQALHPLGKNWEIIITDDYSTDNSWDVIKQLAREDPRIRGQRLATQMGQSAALWAGMKAARGSIIITMDADLQNDPSDIPAFLQALKNYDCVCGSRVRARTQGDNLVRVLASKIANWIRNKITKETVSDAGCCFRAFKRECIRDLKFFHGMHRFFPTLVKIEGFSVTEIPIRHHPRRAGKAHYGILNRLFASTWDLFAIRWMQKRMFPIRVAERTEDTPPT